MTSYPSAPPPGQPGGSTAPGGITPASSGPVVGQAWGAGPGPVGGGGGGAPVCPRHPDRVSYVSCQRCGRPVCPECQRSAAVGVHCVDCVRAAAKSTRPQVTVFGAKTRPGARPVVTITMIAICVAVFLLRFTELPIYEWFAYSPTAGRTEPWRMLTAAFLHASGSFGIIHLGANMIALWFTGPFLEQALGRARFLALYLISALGGSVAVLLLTPLVDWNIGVVGASGAVFGLFAAVAVVMLRLKIRNSSIFGVIGVNLVITFAWSGISWQGHIGGLVTGAVVALLYAYIPKKLRGWGTVVGLAVIVAVLVIATIARYAST